MRTYLLLEVRRERSRKRSALIAKAPPARPARIKVGFSGESSQPPNPSGVCARAGSATTKARASAAKRNFILISTSCRSSAAVHRLLEGIRDRESFHGFERCVLRHTNPTNTTQIIRFRQGGVNAIACFGRLTVGCYCQPKSKLPARVRHLSTIVCSKPGLVRGWSL